MLKWSCCAAAMLVVLIPQVFAQAPRPNSPTSPGTAYSMPAIDLPDFPNAPATPLERQRMAQMNRDRQLALKRDTEKLLEMASDLKQSVDQTNAGILSIDVIKRAQEIEKLAKSVREKMKGY